jgi:hypothetical protein
LCERHALSLTAAEMARIASLEALKPNPIEPIVGLYARALTRDALKSKAERDIIARGAPGQKRIVLEQNANLRWLDAGLDSSLEWTLQSDRGAQQTRLA